VAYDARPTKGKSGLKKGGLTTYRAVDLWISSKNQRDDV
jgi:hypothetical protein